MNKLKLLAAILFFGFFQTSIGQERTKKVKMPKFYKASLPAKSVAVADIQIVQAVPDSTCLGYLQKGLANQKVTAVPDKNLVSFLQDYIKKQYNEDYSKEGVHFLWVIKDLRINERTFFSTESAFARLHADAYVSKDGNLYSFVTSVDTVRVYNSMVDVTSSHGENIAAALHKLLLQALNKTGNVMEDTTRQMTIAQLIANENKRFQIPIINDSVYKEGVYLNFQEFLQNKPSVASYEIQPIDKKTIRVVLTGQDSIKKDLIPWGICKEGELYKFHENELIAIEKRINGFIISDYVDNINRKNRGIFAGVLLGGAIGGAIAGSVASKTYTVNAIPYVKKKQPEASAIDMETGELTF
jgi:hypothetical protein